MAGSVRHGERVVARWAEDAAALGLGVIEPGAARQALEQLGRARFGETGEGIVRLEARAGAEGPDWVGTTRELGPDPGTWRAGLASAAHPGPRDAVGAKRADRALLDRVQRQAGERGWDEGVLLDAEGFAVEGTRSSLLVALPSGRLVTPPLARGAVRGVARSILLDELPELEEDDVRGDELARADELIAVNSVRGARAIVMLDERPVRGGRTGPWAAQLAMLLDANA